VVEVVWLAEVVVELLDFWARAIDDTATNERIDAIIFFSWEVLFSEAREKRAFSKPKSQKKRAYDIAALVNYLSHGGITPGSRKCKQFCRATFVVQVALAEPHGGFCQGKPFSTVFAVPVNR
jgi:hypothetical protein